jgi:hypothetical protein
MQAPRGSAWSNATALLPSSLGALVHRAREGRSGGAVAGTEFPTENMEASVSARRVSTGDSAFAREDAYARTCSHARRNLCPRFYAQCLS